MICFAWSEFPQYAARCVGAFVNATSEDVIVVATRPKVPVRGMEEAAKCKVIWVDLDDQRHLVQLLGQNPRLLIVSGWGVQLFNRYRDEVRRVKCKVVAMCDNNCELSIAQFVKALRFRLYLRRKYDGFLVAGKSGMRLMRLYGVSNRRIRMGLYAADETIFNDGGVRLANRPKRAIFVGQLIPRKNPIRMCRAFIAAGGVEKGWRLGLYGCGPLKDSIPTGRGVFVHDFLQPEQLAEQYRASRIFCLPSFEEHWGLVVHEAALSGCVMLLSDKVGSGMDFLDRENGVRFSPKDDMALVKAWNFAMGMTDAQLDKAQNRSSFWARKFGRSIFVDSDMYFATKL